MKTVGTALRTLGHHKHHKENAQKWAELEFLTLQSDTGQKQQHHETNWNHKSQYAVSLQTNYAFLKASIVSHLIPEFPPMIL